MGEPARRYSWPPFDHGNAVAVKHGADSERFVSPLAERLHAAILEEDSAAWLRRPSFAPAVAAWARAEAKVQLVVDYLDVHGVLDRKGEPRPAATYLLRLESAAANRRAELGLTPPSFARLLAAVADRPEAQEEREALLAEARQWVPS